ncbi:MAG: hypothetical protein WA979_01075, partial [Pacificimonas sp.]
FRDYRFGGAEPVAADAPLTRNGLYPLAGYLVYWASSLNTVLAKIPDDRRLDVRTDDMADRAVDIARFSGIDPAHLRIEKSHAFQNKERFGVIEELDADYVDAMVSRICAPLAERLNLPI